MSVSYITISQNTVDNISWYFIRHNFSRGRNNHNRWWVFRRKQRSNSKVVHTDKEQQQQNKNNNIKISLPASLTNSDMLPGNSPRKRYLMTHNRKGSIATFSISKSVEPNEERKVLISDFGQGITASTER